LRLSRRTPGANATPQSARAGGAPEAKSFRASAFSEEVRQILYTTNAIEALNSKLRRAVRARGHFPNDDAAMKLLFLVLNRSEKEWKMPPREGAMAKARVSPSSSATASREPWPADVQQPAQTRKSG
jgi:hypothetical protein